jgi:cytochrome c556
MKTVSRTLGQTALMLGFAALAACGGGGMSYDHDSPEGQAYEFRHSVMHVAGVKMELINNMARELVPVDEAEFTKAAKELAVLTEMMPEGFEQNLTVDESRAEPAIWENKADFDQRMDAAIEATAKLAETAETSGFAAAQALVVASPGISSNCSGCHNNYRAREDED